MVMFLAVLLFYLFSQALACYTDGSSVACEPPLVDNILRTPLVQVPSVTSTCGEMGPEQICQPLGLLCTHCDANVPSLSHPSSLMTDDSINTYWQSQTYSQIQRHGVNITFNLTKLYSIHSIQLIFHSSRPHSFSIHSSNNYGLSYVPLEYFSQSCQETYNLPSSDNTQSTVTPSCTSQGTGFLPLSGGQSSLILSSPVLATSIQIHLHHLSTLGNERTWNSTVLDSYWYAISDVKIRGRCHCNGHGSSCVERDGRARCVCSHNTTGVDCQMCLASHNDRLWTSAATAMGTQQRMIDCQECNCNGRSSTCRYDPQVYLSSGNLTGGVCENCMNNTGGSQCHICADGFYPNPASNVLECLPCICDPRGSQGSNGTCASVTELYNSSSTCECKDRVEGSTCNRCSSGYFNLTNGCQECNCNLMGSLDNTCDTITGQCICKSPLYYGRTCQSCDCHMIGTADVTKGCDSNGVCSCKRGVGGAKCDRCLHGYYDINQGCLPCQCHINGSVGTGCDSVNGQCTCIHGYYGRDCSSCPHGTHNIGEGCISCPRCFDRVEESYNRTLLHLVELTAAINRTLASVEIDPSLRAMINELYRNLLELSDLQRNLSRRERELWARLTDANVEWRLQQNRATLFSLQVENTWNMAVNFTAVANHYRTLITDTYDQLTSINATLMTARLNVTQITRLVNESNSVIQNIQNITLLIEKTANNQSLTIRRLARESIRLSDNTTELLMSMTEIFDIENSTLDLLRGLLDCTIDKLDVSLREGRVLLSAAVANTTRVSNETRELYSTVMELIQFTSNSSFLLNQSIEALFNSRQVYNDTLHIASINMRLRQNYTSLYDEVRALEERSQELNHTANDILERERRAFSDAISSIADGESVISEIEQLLIRLETELQNVMSFLRKLNALTALVEEAERVSNASLKLTLEIKGNLSKITEIILQSEITLNEVIDTLNEVNQIIMSTNSTVVSTFGQTQELLTNISNIDLNSTEDSINELQTRAERDRLAITKADSIVNTVTMETNSIENLAQNIIEQLALFEALLNSTSLLSPDSIIALNTTLNSHELMLNGLKSLVANATGEIDQLSDMSSTLKEKYKNLQLHRDLLRDMRDNLDDLDCEREFV